jgi:hypothetical protein
MGEKEAQIGIFKIQQSPRDTREYCAKIIFRTLIEIQIAVSKLQSCALFGEVVLLRSLIELYADAVELYSEQEKSEEMCKKYQQYDQKAWLTLLKSIETKNTKKYDVREAGDWNNESLMKKIEKLPVQYVNLYSLASAFAHCNPIHLDIYSDQFRKVISSSVQEVSLKILELLFTTTFFTEEEKAELVAQYR